MIMMIPVPELTLSHIGLICDYLGAIWCVLNLVWGLFRNDANRCLIYGIGCFAAVIIMLNVGGVLNKESWGAFGCAVFGLHLLHALYVDFRIYKVVIYGILLMTSMLSALGVM